MQGRTLPPRDLYITIRLFADNKPLSPIYQTAYKPHKKSSSSTSPLSSLSRTFDETITFPVRLADLPLSSQVTFTVWDAKAIAEIEAEEKLLSSQNSSAKALEFSKVIGGSTMRLFGKKGTLKKASHRLYLWPGQAGDGSVETSTPSKVANEPNKKRDEMARLEKVRRRGLQ